MTYTAKTETLLSLVNKDFPLVAFLKKRNHITGEVKLGTLEDFIPAEEIIATEEKDLETLAGTFKEKLKASIIAEIEALFEEPTEPKRKGAKKSQETPQPE